MKKTKKQMAKLLAILLTFALLFTVVQIPLTVSAEGVENLLPNGTFDTGVTGWKNSNSGWGSLGWDDSLQAIAFTKTSASSGPQIYSDGVEVGDGERITLS